MARGVARYLVGSIVLVTLAACGRSWFAERPAWRHDAEVACLKSGAVKEGAGIAQLRPIQGPGMCGADFPLKVTALGETGPLGFADDPRPPGAIPQYSPIPSTPPRATQAPYPPTAAPGTPMPINPAVDQPADGPGTYAAPHPEPPAYGAPAGP
jgi:hypothetical protein